MKMKDVYKVQMYKKASGTTLRDIYRSWSNEKERAYNACLKMKVDMDGYGFKVICGSSYTFSCGFLYKDENGKEHLMYISKGSNTDILLEED